MKDDVTLRAFTRSAYTAMNVDVQDTRCRMGMAPYKKEHKLY